MTPVATQRTSRKSTKSAKNRGLLLIISGPSGVGKTTITHRVEKALGAVFSVSLTTRPITANDKDGFDYHFVSREKFDKARNNGMLLEWAEVFGNYYGTPREPVDEALESGKLMILEIDVEGAIQVKRLMPEAFALFVLPTNEQVLLDRLRKRNREDEATIQKRFSKAQFEIQRALFAGVYSAFLVNDHLEAAVAQAIGLVKAEWDRRRGAPPPKGKGKR